MRKEDILAYVNRDWAGNEKRKRHWIAAQASRMTPDEALAAGDMLRNYALSLHPEWPTEEHRQEDLATHIRVSKALRSVKYRREDL